MDKVLYIVKKNLLSIICGFVAILAMIALAYPLSGMRTTFRADITKRAQTYTQAQSLLKAQRFLPIVQPAQKPYRSKHSPPSQSSPKVRTPATPCTTRATS